MGWNALTTQNEIGNDTIIHYRLEWAPKTTILVFSDLTVIPYTQTTFTETLATGIFTPDSYYEFRVRGVNNVGSGPVSTLLEI